MTETATEHKQLKLWAVWMARVLVGATFVMSGWAKAVDPWGFLLKINDYLAVWGFDLPRELVLVPSVGLSCLEFCIGVAVLSGVLRRAAVWGAAVIMAFMLPLTLYIWVADPVSDCGCFGDFWVISNGATFAKNIVLSALIVVLLMYNRLAPSIFARPVQWLVIAGSLLFPMALSVYGYNVQPVADFRPYKTGSQLFTAADGADAVPQFVYRSSDGRLQTFALDALPDSSWTFVEALETPAEDSNIGFEVRDENGDPLNDILADLGTPALYIVVPDPTLSFLAFTHKANVLAAVMVAGGGETYGLIGAEGQTLDEWKDLMHPHFELLSAEDTSLKQLARGDAALVLTDSEGQILWKRTLRSVPEDFAGTAADFERLMALDAPDNGRLHLTAWIFFLTWLLGVWLLGLFPKFLLPKKLQTKKNA